MECAVAASLSEREPVMASLLEWEPEISSRAIYGNMSDVEPPRVAAHLPEAVLGKIWRGSLVDFNLLLKEAQLPDFTAPMAKHVGLSADPDGNDTFLSVTTFDPSKQ